MKHRAAKTSSIPYFTLFIAVLLTAAAISACGKKEPPTITIVPGTEPPQTSAPATPPPGAPDNPAAATPDPTAPATPPATPPPSVTPVTPDPSLAPSAGTVGDYFPLTPDALYEYTSSDASVDQKTYVMFQNGARTQRRAFTGTVSSTEVLDSSGGKLTLIFSDPMYDFFTDLTDSKPTANAVILAEPLSVGNRWMLDPTTTCAITSVDQDVTVPAGTFKAVVVETRLQNGIVQTDYYAKGVGNVKSEYIQNGVLVSIELNRVVKDTPLMLPINVSNVGKDGKTVESGVQQLQFRTNGSFKDLIEAALKKPAAAGSTPMLPRDGKLRALSFDWKASTMTADFSPELEQAPFASDDAIQSNLQCIADTLGQFYRIDQVCITVGGKPFAQGGVRQEAQHYLKVARPAGVVAG